MQVKLKRIQNFFVWIRSLPEEVRRFLALLIIAVAGIAVFTSWTAVVSSRLITISNETPFTIIQSNDPGVLSPAEGVAETVKSIGSVAFKDEDDVPSSSGFTTAINRAYSAIGKTLFAGIIAAGNTIERFISSLRVN